MNKKILAILCLLSLVKYSNGYQVETENNIPISNEEKNLKLKSKNHIVKAGIAAASVMGLDSLLHCITNTALYPGRWAELGDEMLPFPEESKLESYELTSGGATTVLIPKNTPPGQIKNTWICFPGNAMNGKQAVCSGYYLFAPEFKNDEAFVGLDYPGYGRGSDKWINAKRLQEVANETYEWVKKTYPNSSINIYGFSLGGYPATRLLDKDDINNFYLHSPIRLDSVLANSKLLTYALNWENLNYIDNMFEQVPKRKNPCNVFIVSGGGRSNGDDFLSLFDTLTPKEGQKIKEKLIDGPNGKLNLDCKVLEDAGHGYCPYFSNPNLKSYDILTGKIKGA